jgi:pilus assembly protein CpaB
MNRRLLMIALAVVLALVGTGAVYTYVKHADTRALAGTKAADVLIVQKRIPTGTSVKDVQAGGYLKADHVPATSAPVGAITALSSEMSAQVATADLQPGQIVLKDSFGDFVPTTSGLNIPDGMMAVSFSVQTPADVAGYVQPKSQIAIFDTFKLVNKDGTPTTKSGADANKATKLLLARVQVLAVSSAAPKATDKAAGNGTLLVTVALNQADAERLIHESESGSMYLALLSQTSKTGPSHGVDNLGLLGPVFPISTTTTP